MYASVVLRLGDTPDVGHERPAAPWQTSAFFMRTASQLPIHQTETSRPKFVVDIVSFFILLETRPSLSCLVALVVAAVWWL
jgi:hypothetical protein